MVPILSKVSAAVAIVIILFGTSSFRYSSAQLPVNKRMRIYVESKDYDKIDDLIQQFQSYSNKIVSATHHDDTHEFLFVYNQNISEQTIIQEFRKFYTDYRIVESGTPIGTEKSEKK